MEGNNKFESLICLNHFQLKRCPNHKRNKTFRHKSALKSTLSNVISLSSLLNIKTIKDHSLCSSHFKSPHRICIMVSIIYNLNLPTNLLHKRATLHLLPSIHGKNPLKILYFIPPTPSTTRQINVHLPHLCEWQRFRVFFWCCIIPTITVKF